ncbi:hypothetical protein NL676_018225 [Syzygium grande]|nr:hypothetical protein NL676_018225 [Syzygium grande]
MADEGEKNSIGAKTCALVWATRFTHYAPSIVAKVTYTPSQFNGNRDRGVTVLANYIGTLAKPLNTKPEKIAMTGLRITKSEKNAMMAPVVTKGSSGVWTAGTRQSSSCCLKSM